MNPESISKPVPVGLKFGIFYLISKVEADGKKFKSELKEKYVNRVISQKKYERYVEWATEIRERANLKDYLPRPEPTASTKPSSANSS